MYFDNIQVVNCLVGFSRSATALIAALMIVRHCTLIIFCCCSRLSSLLHHSQIAQGEISRSVAFPTHVWKMPNICNHIIVWLFSHMCAFSHTYVSKSKHVWKKAPRCKYTNVFGFFQTCWVKVKHLPKCNFTHRFGFFLTYLQKQTCKEKTNMFSLNTTILFFFVGNEDFVIRSCSFQRNFV